MSPLPALALVLIPSTSPKDLFDGCVRAHRAMKAGNVRLDISQKLRGKTTTSHYEVSFVRPSQVKIRLLEPEQSGRAASDRTFALLGNKFYGYDASVHERLERSAPKQGTLIQKLQEMIGNTDDALLALIEPDRLAGFLTPFRAAPDWKVTTIGSIVVLSRKGTQGGKSNTTYFRFETATKRLRGLEIDISDGRLEWSISYGPAPKTINFKPPPDAVEVAAFTQRPIMPSYADKRAKAIAERAMDAYDRLHNLAYKIRGAGDSQVWISNRSIREETSALSYVWNGKAVFIKDLKTHAFYSGKAGLSGLMEALAKLGIRMDPTARQIVARQNPVRILLVPYVKVRYLGDMSLNGAIGDLLSFKTGTSTVTLHVRRGDGMLGSIRSEIHDPSGAVVSESVKEFLYGSVGKRIDPTVFKMDAPAGFKKHALSELPK